MLNLLRMRMLFLKLLVLPRPVCILLAFMLAIVIMGTMEKVNGRVRKFSNGLVIEDLVMNPERVSILATPGSTVLISYVGQLKSNGLVFDSSFSKPPFLFKLGAGEVIKGWDIGINGMRIGDKRRLTIPPSLAYGSKGRENVPLGVYI
ncbi:peptidyl-prolyl cis-trans isomerase FKBP53-like isoform X2 [Papaver somniferum]|uniref:peptidyl-prolyl cis-trans isomerase FKBP53-like isoform X2 n=1 Tax=Papaver somniferum TaxID=3469 RepID=UPI000E6FEC67|nr:peptidyl-prolyl cis-trans isomerase FKBP53-like isoform X2 [Papaver somniferum]